jgi:5-(carboxyamino)imidazole ribonucleotide mutase
MVDISVIMGSESDRSIANRATTVLDKSKYTYEVMVISAHRNPDELDSYMWLPRLKGL